MDSYDSRLKRLVDNPRFIIINNYKCGFSSSNLLAFEAVEKISDDDEIVFFYRSIVLRAISVFINWCITDDRYLYGKDWLLENLKRELSDSSYQDLLSLLRTRRYAEAFGIYVEALESIYEDNDHTLPQVTVLERYSIDRVDHFVELENSEALMQIAEIRFPVDYTNKSNIDIKQSLIRYLCRSHALQSCLQRIYRKDVDFFAEHELQCVRWQELA